VYVEGHAGAGLIDLEAQQRQLGGVRSVACVKRLNIITQSGQSVLRTGLIAQRDGPPSLGDVPFEYGSSMGCERMGG
jgi:hypothetical protein